MSNSVVHFETGPGPKEIEIKLVTSATPRKIEFRGEPVEVKF